MSTTIEREAWLTERRKGIGASECSALFGKHPWKTPLQVYMEKVGIYEQEQTPRMLWGLRWESLIAEAYCEEVGCDVAKPAAILRHPDAPWMLASLDYWRPGDRVVEIKKVSQHAAKEFGEAGSDQIPEHYMLQCQQQMACSGLDTADLAALIGDDDLRIYTVRLNIEIVARLIVAERDFMERVDRRDPPLPDFTHPTTAQLLALIEPEVGRAIDLDEAAAMLADDYDGAGKLLKEVESQRDSLKSQLLHAMGDAECAYLPDGRQLTRKLVEVSGYTVAPKCYYRFGIKAPKKARAN